MRGDRRLNGSVFGRLSLPIYSGGETSAKVREAREIATRRRIEADSARTQVRAGIIRAWSQYQSSKVRLAAAQEQVRAASTALQGVREEFGLGQRTAANVLDAVQDLLSASINLASAQRERVLTSYGVSRALGKLSLAGIEAGAQGSPQVIVDQFAQLAIPFRQSANLARWELRGSNTAPSPLRAPFAATASKTDMVIRSTFQ